MYWILGVLEIFVLLVLRGRFSSRARVCKHVLAAQQALDRRDFQSFDQNLERSKQMAEKLRDEPLRLEFRGDLALMSVQGAYIGEAILRLLKWLPAMRSKSSRRWIPPTPTESCPLLMFSWETSFWTVNSLLRRQSSFVLRQVLRRKEVKCRSQRFSHYRDCPEDALLEDEKREDATSVIEHCVEIERGFFASQKEAPGISMTAPDQSLVRADFATAERLFDEKVRYFESPRWQVVRHRRDAVSIASSRGAQQGQGKIEKAQATLTSARDAAETMFGPQHPRVATIRRKLESIQQH